MSAICNSTIQQIKKDYPELKVADACPVCGLKIGLHQNSPEPTGIPHRTPRCLRMKLYSEFIDVI